MNSGLDFALNSPDAILNPDPANTKNNLKNYWCGTAAVPNAENFTIFAPFTAVQTRFFVLNPTTHAALIEQIRAGRDQLEITPSLFTSLNITKSSAPVSYTHLFVEWIQTSPVAAEENAAKNNHGLA